MLFPTLGRRNDLMVEALDWDLESFGRTVWKKLAVFYGRVQWLEVWFCCSSIVLDFTEITVEAREVCRMEVVQEVDFWGGGREWVRLNSAGHSMGSFLTNPSFAFSHSGGDWIWLWSDLPTTKYNSWGQINLLFSAWFWHYLENSWFSVFCILSWTGILVSLEKNNLCSFATGFLCFKSLLKILKFKVGALISLSLFFCFVF